MAQLKEVLDGFTFHTFVYSLFLLLASIIFVYETVKKICSIFGIKFKHLEDKNTQAKQFLDLEKTQSTIQAKIAEIEMQSIKHDQALESKLNDLTNMVIDDRIDRMRYEILDMASAISEAKRWYSVEQIRHTLKIYDEYEKFLQDHNRQNGEVEISIEIIKKALKDKYDNMEGVKR